MAAAGTLADRQAEEGIPRPRRPHRPVALLTISSLVAAVLALPLVFLLIEARGAGASEVLHLIFRPLTWSLLWNTVRLTVVVTVACAVIGTAAAWCVERTDLPGRRVWAVLVVVPLAIPDFVVSFGWNSLWTWAHGFPGAVIVMTLAVYPLVYLPVAASLRMADPGSGGGRAKPGLGPRPHLRPDHARPGQGGHPRRLPAGRPCPAGRVRCVRDPRLPDLHHRDLHRAQRVQLRRLMRALPGACGAQPARPGRGRRAPRAAAGSAGPAR